MNSIAIVNAIFIKEIKDILKNIQVLFLFFIFPAIGAAMAAAMSGSAAETAFFLAIFASIHCIFTPIMTTSSIIAEEKEKNTLRVLIMSNVKPYHYLLSIGGFVFISTMVTGASFLLIGECSSNEIIPFLLTMAASTLISVVLGMAIGVNSKNMMSANGLAVPAGLIFGFLPMLASFNESIERIGKYTYGVQINKALSALSDFEWSSEFFLIVGGNFLVFLVFFIVLFKKKSLDE